VVRVGCGLKNNIFEFYEQLKAEASKFEPGDRVRCRDGQERVVKCVNCADEVELEGEICVYSPFILEKIND